jgi:hypothetical protein
MEAMTAMLVADGLSEGSITKYQGILRLLGGEFKDLSFLDNHVSVLYRIKMNGDKPATEHTQKGRLTAVMSVLRIIKAPKELYDVYRAVFDDLNAKLTAFEESGVKNDKQQAYYMTKDEISEKMTWLRESATCIDNRYYDRVNYLLWSLYTLIPPRRTMDYHLMDVADRDTGNLSNEKNWYIRSQGLFVFNRHKNWRVSGTERYNISNNPTMLGVMEFHLHNLPPHERNEQPLLQIVKGQRCSKNFIGDRLSKIAGKKLGPNALRHLYAEHNAPSREALDKLLADAADMGHSIVTHITAYIKKL